MGEVAKAVAAGEPIETRKWHARRQQLVDGLSSLFEDVEPNCIRVVTGMPIEVAL
jgi:hypothetical protein